MSRISELANSFKQETERLERNTQIALNQTLSKYESSINDSLKTSQKAIENSMKEIVENEYQKQQQQAEKRLKTTKKWGGLIILGLSTVCVLIMLGARYMANKEYDKMTEYKQSAEAYQKISHQLNIQRCTISDSKSQSCIEIDPNYKNQYWGEDENLVILPITEK